MSDLSEITAVKQTERFAWTTQHEIAFVAQLGEHMQADARKRSYTRSLMLSGYLAGARQRKDWGKVDGEAVINHAEELLRVELSRVRKETMQ